VFAATRRVRRAPYLGERGGRARSRRRGGRGDFGGGAVSFGRGIWQLGIASRVLGATSAACGRLRHPFYRGDEPRGAGTRGNRGGGAVRFRNCRRWRRRWVPHARPTCQRAVAGRRVRLVKALVWFWIIDETLVLTSILSVDLMRLVHAK